MEISPEVNLLLEQSRSLEISGDFPQALCKAQQALELAQSHGDEEGTARALTYLGIIHFRLGNYSTSRAFAQQSLNHADSNPRSRAETLLLLGTLAMEEDSLDDIAAASVSKMGAFVPCIICPRFTRCAGSSIC